MKVSKYLMEEINAVIKMYKHTYAALNKEHLHIADCMLYICNAFYIQNMIGVELKKGDIFIIIDNGGQKQLKLYINKDFCYTVYDKWNFREDIFLPLEGEFDTIAFEDIRQKYYDMMGFTVRTLDDPIIDEHMIQWVIQKRRSLLVIRNLANGEEYDHYYVDIVTDIQNSEQLNKKIRSCTKGNIILVSHYTGYGYLPSRNNTTVHIGVMDVTKEDAEKLDLKFCDMYKDYILK